MTAIDPNASLGDLAFERPGAARIFERLGLEYCCGGKRTLAESCTQRELDSGTVIALLDALDAGAPDPALEEHDLRGASIGELCDHIVAAHHVGLRDELPRISSLIAVVVRVHGASRPELLDLQRAFAGMRSELEGHLEEEESTLFPACRRLADGVSRASLDQAALALAEDEHEQVGDALAALRELTGGYRDEDALCGTHKVLLRSLRELELDLHQHVHEENNVLFPRVRARLAGDRAATTGG